MCPQLSIGATEQLSLSHDGRIPDRLWQAARKIEGTHKARQAIARNPRVQVGHITMKPDLAVALMADTIVRSAIARGCVDKLDLQQVGFSEAQINEYHDDAFALAITEEPRIVSILAQDA